MGPHSQIRVPPIPTEFPDPTKRYEAAGLEARTRMGILIVAAEMASAAQRSAHDRRRGNDQKRHGHQKSPLLGECG